MQRNSCLAETSTRRSPMALSLVMAAIFAMVIAPTAMAREKVGPRKQVTEVKTSPKPVRPATRRPSPKPAPPAARSAPPRTSSRSTPPRTSSRSTPPRKARAYPRDEGPLARTPVGKRTYPRPTVERTGNQRGEVGSHRARGRNHDYRHRDNRRRYSDRRYRYNNYRYRYGYERYAPLGYSYCPYFGYYGPFSVYVPFRRNRYYGGYAYGGYGGYGYGGRGYDDRYYSGTRMGAFDMDVSPEEAQIFVDGRQVGIADEYDGFPEYLWLEEGTYDIAIYHPGYETIVRQYSVRPGSITSVDDDMRSGEAIHPETLATPATTVNRDHRLERERERQESADRRRDIEHSLDGDIGRLVILAYPGDAAIYLDGNFLGTAAELSQLSAGLVVDPGRHTIEVVRPGYATKKQTVTVPPGERIEVDLDLASTSL